MELTVGLLCALALWQPALPAARQDADADCRQHAGRVYTTREVDEKAKLTHRREPVYPARMRERRRNGQTKLRMVLRPDGTVTDIEVMESSHEEFSKTSTEAARKLVFEPAIEGGCPVAQSTVIINHYTTY
jgi:TonB family protein